AFQAARSMLRLEQLPRHEDCVCPSCGEAPPRGDYWQCEHCVTRFDTFLMRGRCPGCGAWYLETACPHCHATNHIDAWFRPGGGGEGKAREEDATGASRIQDEPSEL